MMRLPSWLKNSSSWLWTAALSRTVQRRLLAFALRKLIGSILLENVQPEDIDILFSKGVLMLSNLQLNCSFLNAVVSLPMINFTKGTLRRLILRLNVTDIVNLNVELEVNGLSLEIELVPPDESLSSTTYEDAPSQLDILDNVVEYMNKTASQDFEDEVINEGLESEIDGSSHNLLDSILQKCLASTSVLMQDALVYIGTANMSTRLEAKLDFMSFSSVKSNSTSRLLNINGITVSMVRPISKSNAGSSSPPRSEESFVSMDSSSSIVEGFENDLSPSQVTLNESSIISSNREEESFYSVHDSVTQKKTRTSWLIFQCSGEFRLVFSIESSNLLVIESHVPSCVLNINSQVIAFLLYLYGYFLPAPSTPGFSSNKPPLTMLQLDIHISSVQILTHCKLPESQDFSMHNDVDELLHTIPSNGAVFEMKINQIQIFNDNNDIDELTMTFSDLDIFMDSVTLVSFGKSLQSPCSLIFKKLERIVSLFIHIPGGEISLPLGKALLLQESFVEFTNDISNLQNFLSNSDPFKRSIQETFEAPKPFEVEMNQPSFEIIALFDELQLQILNELSTQSLYKLTLRVSHLQFTRKSTGSLSSVLIFVKKIGCQSELFNCENSDWTKVSSSTAFHLSNSLFETHDTTGTSNFAVSIQQEKHYYPVFQPAPTEFSYPEKHFYFAVDNFNVFISKEVVRLFKTLYETIASSLVTPVTPNKLVTSDYKNVLKIRTRTFSLSLLNDDGSSFALKCIRIKHYMCWAGAQLISLSLRLYNVSAEYLSESLEILPVVSFIRNLRNDEKYLLNADFSYALKRSSGSNDNTIFVKITDLGYEHYPTCPWISDLLKTYFPQDPEVPFLAFPDFPFNIKLDLRESIIGLNPRTLEAKLLLYLKSLDVEIDALVASNPLNIRIMAAETVVYIIDKLNQSVLEGKTSVLKREILNSSLHFPGLSIKDTIEFVVKSLGYVEISQLKNLTLSLVVNAEEGVFSTLITVDNLDAQVQSCADSTELLIKVLSDLGSTEDEEISDCYLALPIEDYAKSLTEVDYNFFENRGIDYKSNPTEQSTVLVSSDNDISSQEIKIVDDYYISSNEHSTHASDLASVSSEEFVIDDGSSSIIDISDELQDESSSRDSLKKGIELIEDYYLSQSTSKLESSVEGKNYLLKVKFKDINVNWDLHDGYDWEATRATISSAIEKLCDFSSQNDKISPEAKTLLFQSIVIKSFSKVGRLNINHVSEPIDSDEFADYLSKSISYHLRLGKSKSKKIGIEIKDLQGSFTVYADSNEPNAVLNDLDIGLKDLIIYDHLSTSTWNKFFGRDSRSPSSKNRNQHMNAQIVTVRPLPELNNRELRLEFSVLPCKMYIDQDTLDFLIRFLTFQTPSSSETLNTEPDLPFFQSICINATHVTIDFKFKSADKVGLRSGKLPDLGSLIVMQGSEVFLRQLQIYGLSGAEEFLNALLNVWLQDIRNNQLSKVLNGVVPIRTMFTVGRGIKDIFVSPVRGLQGNHSVGSFRHGIIKFTEKYVNDFLSLNAQGATGTHSLLRQAESYLERGSNASASASRARSYYAEQPETIEQGLRQGYSGLKQGLLGAKSTLMGLPRETRSHKSLGGVAQTVGRKVPLIVLQPMIGATEAVSKTLLGLSNSLQPQRRQDMREKYKRPG
ncbi:hypothetical protein POMI540_2577 [Schizosaccharomyces pombe]